MNEQTQRPGDTDLVEPLSNREIDTALRDLRGWDRQEGGLRRRFRRASFMDAIDFVNRIARIADEMQHHPNIDIRFRSVIVFMTTHEAGGVTRLDLQLAARISELET